MGENPYKLAGGGEFHCGEQTFTISLLVISIFDPGVPDFSPIAVGSLGIITQA